MRMDSGKYCLFTDAALKVASVKMVGNLHIAVKDETKDGQLFRYEAIAPGQRFSGIIQCENEADAEIWKEMISGKDFYLGGSKGSGYGHVQIESAELISFEELQKTYHLNPVSTPGILSVYFLSNALILDKNGAVCGRIPEDLLESELGITDVKLLSGYSAVMRTAGYNHTWKSHNVQAAAVKAGSYYRYSYKGELDPEKLKRFEEKGVGSRRTEGFGRILFNREFGDRRRIEISSYEEENSPGKLSEGEKQQYESIQTMVNRERIRKYIQKCAVESSDSCSRSNDYKENLIFLCIFLFSLMKYEKTA